MKSLPKELIVSKFLLLLVITGLFTLGLQDGHSLSYFDLWNIAAALFQLALFQLLSPVLYFSTPVFLLALVAEHQTHLGLAVLVLATVSHLPLLIPRSRKAIRNPRLRWWRTVPRKTLFLTVQVRPVLGGELLSKTINISETGAFVSLRGARWTNSRGTPLKNMKVGTYCALQLNLDQIYAFTCTAEVVRHSSKSKNNPEGVGLRFTFVSPEEKSRLASFLALVREDSYVAEMDTLVA